MFIWLIHCNCWCFAKGDSWAGAWHRNNGLHLNSKSVQSSFDNRVDNNQPSDSRELLCEVRCQMLVPYHITCAQCHRGIEICAVRDPERSPPTMPGVLQCQQRRGAHWPTAHHFIHFIHSFNQSSDKSLMIHCEFQHSSLIMCFCRTADRWEFACKEKLQWVHTAHVREDGFACPFLNLLRSSIPTFPTVFCVSSFNIGPWAIAVANSSR